jgi:hypothetical protein
MTPGARCQHRQKPTYLASILPGIGSCQVNRRSLDRTGMGCRLLAMETLTRMHAELQLNTIREIRDAWDDALICANEYFYAVVNDLNPARALDAFKEARERAYNLTL